MENLKSTVVFVLKNLFASSSNKVAELSLLHPGLEYSGPRQLSAEKRSKISNTILLCDLEITPESHCCKNAL